MLKFNQRWRSFVPSFFHEMSSLCWVFLAVVYVVCLIFVFQVISIVCGLPRCDAGAEVPCAHGVPGMPGAVYISFWAEGCCRQQDCSLMLTWRIGKITFVNRACDQLFKSCWSNFKLLMKRNGVKKEIGTLPGMSSNPVVISFQTGGLNCIIFII